MQYVCARIIRMDDVDIALFERDWNNTLYYFVMNADEHIYMRYGGRDARGPTTYLDLDSLELALAKGLELHQQYKNGEIKKGGAAEARLRSRDSASGGTHVRPQSVRRVPSDWRFSASVSRTAGQAG